ncbi:MAG: sortase, partial [Chloroflexota bacterium]|nr:sortase [Chloroflexota bacterium]
PDPANLSIALVKGFDPLLVTGGAASTMSIQLINPETIPLTGIAFTDNMPAGMILANPVNFNVGTCGGMITGSPGDGSFSYSGGSLPALGTCTLTLSATMMVNGNLTNTIPAGSVTSTNGATNVDPAEASLTNLPGVSVSKIFAPNPIPVNGTSLLTITIANTGNIELVQMSMSDSLPAGLQVAGGPVPVNNCGGALTAIPGTQLIQLTGGNLAGNATCTIVVGITGSIPGDYLNTIPIGGLVADPNTRNTSPATATLTITAGGGSSPTPPPGGGGGGGRNNNNPPATNPGTGGAFVIPVTGFAPGRLTQLDSFERAEYDATALTLEIPVLRVKAAIVGVEANRGKWDVSWLQDQVGWLHGSAYPGWKGNSVLTAHVVNADGEAGTFSRLKALGVGEYVFLYSGGYRYTYKVVSNALVQPTDSSVMKHEQKSYLTLITCDSYDERTGTYLKRVAVRAVLVDVSPVK